MRESDLPNKNLHGTVRRLMRVGGFFVLSVRDHTQHIPYEHPKNVSEFPPICFGTSCCGNEPPNLLRRSPGGLMNATTIQFLRAVDERSDSIVRQGIEPGKN